MPFIARRVRQEWERAVQLDPSHLGAQFALFEFYDGAPAAFGGGEEKAKMKAAEVARLSPMRGALARGALAASDKDAARELAALGEAVSLAPDSLAPYVALIDALVRLERSREMLSAIEPYVRRHPENAWARFHLGRAAASSGTELARGDSALVLFIATPPFDLGVSQRALAHYWRGRIAEQRGDATAARALYEAALRINPNSRLSKRALDALDSSPETDER
jgi:tetratricopeptide (TPR) repeat protein